ncbi:hypothetical protein AMTR_s00043p00203400 [Amborella trichopoda]|uniref:Uncharacterized protein n=1 Tax=Amborella trichopoda TaxID=13333 RepID=W1PRZ2_AMBTC|nr:hypothetical protein AMTR_s00043p00203400 [Amborella trichopoda]
MDYETKSGEWKNSNEDAKPDVAEGMLDINLGAKGNMRISKIETSRYQDDISRPPRQRPNENSKMVK